MMIQTPGSFVWSASLAGRLGVEGWSTWGIFLVTGCLQGCLLVMGIMFEYKARKEAREQVSIVRSREEIVKLTQRSLAQSILIDMAITLKQMMKEERTWRLREHH